jgi:glycine cleavage system aminomethyltransferase T
MAQTTECTCRSSAPENIGWRAEQAAWREKVTICDLLYHIWNLWIEGPDALRLLKDYSTNNYDTFVVGQAKQSVPVTARAAPVPLPGSGPDRTPEAAPR